MVPGRVHPILVVSNVRREKFDGSPADTPLILGAPVGAISASEALRRIFAGEMSRGRNEPGNRH